MVVGYDGAPPARHALDQAVDLLRDRKGALEVVYVADLPVGVGMGRPASPEAFAEFRRGLDEQARALAEEIRDRLVGTEVVIVMGASAHHHHALPGSVGSSVVRSRTFPALVVP